MKTARGMPAGPGGKHLAFDQAHIAPAEVGQMVPFGRMGKPEDLIGMAIFLATSEADYIVAQTYNVDGGQWMS